MSTHDCKYGAAWLELSPAARCGRKGTIPLYGRNEGVGHTMRVTGKSVLPDGSQIDLTRDPVPIMATQF